MLLLDTTSSVIRIVTGSAASINVDVNYIDLTTGTGALLPDTPAVPAAITTATTTTIVAAPASGVVRNVRGIAITNNHASASTQVTVQKFDGTNAADLMSVTLLPGENLILLDDGEWRHHDIQGAEYFPVGQNDDAYTKGYGITDTIAETMSRNIAGVNAAVLTSGTLFLQAIYLRAGQTISNITFFSGTTAAATPTNGFFALYDINRNLLANCANFTTEAWAANSAKTKALTAAYKVPTTGLYYVGIMIAATTVPSLTGVTAAANAAFKGQTPILAGNSTTALTTTLPNPAAAITAGVNSVWAALT